MADKPKDPPVTLFLQWNPEDAEWGSPSPGDTTWCDERVFDSDVEYIRADDVEKTIRQLCIDLHNAQLLAKAFLEELGKVKDD